MGSIRISAQQLGRRDVFLCGGNLSPQKYHSWLISPTQPSPWDLLYLAVHTVFLKPNGRSFLLPFLRLSLFGTTTVVLTDMLGVKLQWCPLWSLGSGADLVNWQWATMEIHRKKYLETENWVVGSNIFYFQPYSGKIPILTNIFSDGLKPPTRKWMVGRWFISF